MGIWEAMVMDDVGGGGSGGGGLGGWDVGCGYGERCGSVKYLELFGLFFKE